MIIKCLVIYFLRFLEFYLAFFLHLSEQYFTLSQFLAQDFRHVIGRWQTTQILLGKLTLLPLKICFDNWSDDCSLATLK